MDDKIDKIRDYAEENLIEEHSGHGWQHTKRVWKMAKTISEEEGGDDFIVQASSLLHDLTDWKLDNKKKPKEIRKFLLSLDIEKVDKILKIMKNISFKGAETENDIKSIEGKIVQDADRLDAMGAIGIARCFSYGGSVGQKIYDPELEKSLHKNFDEYKESETTSINHFYEKLLLLKDRMNTETGKRLAEERHRYMEDFLDRFFEEIEIEK